MALCLQMWTSPNLPDPTHLPSSKSLIVRGSLELGATESIPKLLIYSLIAKSHNDRSILYPWQLTYFLNLSVELCAYSGCT